MGICLFIAESISAQQLVSYVDTSLSGSEKYVLKVDDRPFYMISIQLRMDLMRHSQKWSAEAREALVAQVAADGFNAVNIPLHWVEVEPEKDKFDWDILDEYLTLVNKYGLKMEILWFGANSGGHVQWLSRSKTEPVHLRTPDYVLYAPLYGSPTGEGFQETTSEYTISRERSNYTLDMSDDRLCNRETYVLSQVMKHIAEWDKKHAERHPVIGVQIGNEVVGYRHPFPNEVVLSYLNRVAGAVKQSDYKVWTRVNCVFWNADSRIYGNEALRLSEEGTNLDFVGIDTYRHHLPSDEAFIASMRDKVPYVGKNFRMIMETNAEKAFSPFLHLAALSGNTAFNYYDSYGLYNRYGQSDSIVVIADKECWEGVRLVNRILGNAQQDVAVHANGYGLFVHNWQATHSESTTSSFGVSFSPAYPTSQAVSIRRSPSEILLMSTKGGVFSWVDSLDVEEVSEGYVGKDNNWVTVRRIDGQNMWRNGIKLEDGVTARILHKPIGLQEPAVIYQAELAELSMGALVENKVEKIGFAGNGYVKLPASEGALVTWKQVEVKETGIHQLRIRYSLEGDRHAKHTLTVNGIPHYIVLKPTGSAAAYRYFTLDVFLNAGKENEISLESNYNYKRPNKVVVPAPAGNIDELQVL